MFQERLYAHSGNFKHLVEPLDRANFSLVNEKEMYEEGHNRPWIYVQIEEAQKDNKSSSYF